MLGRIVTMLRGGRRRSHRGIELEGLFASRTQKAAYSELSAVAPLVNGADLVPAAETLAASRPPEPANSPIVRREAVLGSTQRVAGYVFGLVYKANPRVQASSISLQRLHDKVLLRNLQAMEIQRLLEFRLAFVDVSVSSLGKPFIEDLPPHGVVYVLDAHELVEADHAPSLRRLRALGYRIGLRGVDAGPPLLELADYLFIDIGNSDIPFIHDQIEAARKRLPAPRFVAANIQTREEYRVCARLPFAFHQGPFITSREKLDAPGMDAGRIKILELLNRLRGEAEVPELAALIRQNLALAYKLLRYINSPGMRQMHEVATPEQALMVLGRQKLHRWLAILLFTSGKSTGLDWAVMENALIRARLAELSARHALAADERDELFVAGMFSLLDVVLSMPMEAVLRQVSLPAPVNEALLHRTGKYAPYLALAIACEQSDEANIGALSQAIGLEAWRVDYFHLEAMLWAQQIGGQHGTT